MSTTPTTTTTTATKAAAPAAAPRKSVLVTGCSKGGIGDALAQEYHRKGCRVFPTVRDPSKAAHLVELGIAAEDVIVMDVAKTETVEAAVKTVREATGGTLDILVNNAGTALGATVLDSELATSKYIFDVNLWGVLTCIQAFSPLLIASGDGRIVNIGSIFGCLAPPFTSIYNAAKAALASLSDTLRVELAPFNVHVIHVIAGIVSTSIVASAATNLPDHSIYAPAKEHIAPECVDGKTLLWAMGHKRASPDRFARSVVADSLKKRPKGIVWRGHLTGLVWITTRLVPTRLKDFVSAKIVKLDKVKPAVEKARVAS